MKIIVDSMPRTPHDCIFSQIETTHDPKIIPHCQFKLNKMFDLINTSYSYGPTKLTCSLAKNEECPYLTTIERHNQDYIEGPNFLDDSSEDIITGGPRTPIDFGILSEINNKMLDKSEEET